jgi:CheY-like chemotaxis protein
MTCRLKLTKRNVQMPIRPRQRISRDFKFWPSTSVMVVWYDPVQSDQHVHRELPIIVVTSSNLTHATAFACLNGAAVCLAKPITASEVELVLTELCRPKLQLIGA